MPLFLWASQRIEAESLTLLQVFNAGFKAESFFLTQKIYALLISIIKSITHVPV